MTVQGASQFVQTEFPDQFGSGFPGQLTSSSGENSSEVTQFPNETVVFCGRAVVKKTAQDFSNLDMTTSAPYTITAPENTSTADQLVGVVIRPLYGTQNFTDPGSTVPQAGFGEKLGAVPVLKFGSRQTIQVRQAASISPVVEGEPVYAVINVPNAFGLNVGEFSNEADGANTILVPGAIWYRSKSTADAVNNINEIQLL